MIIDAKELKAAVSKCGSGIDAGTGLTQAGKVIFAPGYIMGCGTSINVRVPCASVDISAMIDKAALDKVLTKATGPINFQFGDASVVIRHGRSRVTVPFMDLPKELPEFPDEFELVQPEFISKLKAVSFPNKTGYAGVAWDAESYPGLIATDSVRIVIAEHEGLPGGAWLPEAAVTALAKAGNECTGIINDMPYIHAKYSDGTICSVLYRAISDFPIPALCGYIQAFEASDVVASGELNEDVLGAIKEAEGFTDAFSAQMPVHISFTPGVITVMAANSSGEFCGEGPWEGDYTGNFTVDASPFRLMHSGIVATIRKTDDENILLSLEGAGTRVLLSPDS